MRCIHFIEVTYTFYVYLNLKCNGETQFALPFTANSSEQRPVYPTPRFSLVFHDEITSLYDLVSSLWPLIKVKEIMCPNTCDTTNQIFTQKAVVYDFISISSISLFMTCNKVCELKSSRRPLT